MRAKRRRSSTACAPRSTGAPATSRSWSALARISTACCRHSARPESRYAAVELDALAERQAILDLESLTHALIQPADRLAWLAVLRAPWCGLALADIFALAAAADAQPAASIAALIDAPDGVAGMSADGAARLQIAASILRPALGARGRGSLTARVRGAWLALGGPATLEEAIDFEAAERFFGLLVAHERAGDVPDWSAFVGALRELYAAPADEATARVQVMTLHRAKGLEFDTVILPGLARRTAGRDAELLRLRIRERGPLVAPSRARGSDADPVYAYLGLLAADEDRAELGRLLYVGCTRAKSRLHLCTPLDVAPGSNGQLAWVAPPRDSALGRLGDAIVAMMPAPPPAARSRRHSDSPSAAPRSCGVALATAAARRRRSGDRRSRVRSTTCRSIGRTRPLALSASSRTAGSRSLPAKASTRGATHGSRRLRHASARSLPRPALMHASSIARPERSSASSRTSSPMRAGAGCSRRGTRTRAANGRSPASTRATVAHVAVDRTFVADGVRWIVDFKTGRHEGADPEAFLDRSASVTATSSSATPDSCGRSTRARFASASTILGCRGWREWPYAAGEA